MTTMYVACYGESNVGGKNLIKMPAPKASFEVGGFEDVVTYIQSGNVLLRTGRASSSALACRIEEILRSASGRGESYPWTRHGRARMATFVLIHGAGDSAWYWHLVEPELRGRGHDVVTMDLPCDDDSAGLAEYADTVVDAIGGPRESRLGGAIVRWLHLPARM